MYFWGPGITIDTGKRYNFLIEFPIGETPRKDEISLNFEIIKIHFVLPDSFPNWKLHRNLILFSCVVVDILLLFTLCKHP